MVVAFGLADLAFGLKEQGIVQVGPAYRGVALCGLGVKLHGALLVPQGLERDGQVVHGYEIVRLELYRLFVLKRRLGELALLFQREAQVVVEVRIVWILLYGVPEEGFGLLVFSGSYLGYCVGINGG